MWSKGRTEKQQPLFMIQRLQSKTNNMIIKKNLMPEIIIDWMEMTRGGEGYFPSIQGRRPTAIQV